MQLDRDFMNCTENKKERWCVWLWVGSKPKELQGVCREGKLVLVPHSEGRAGFLHDGWGNGVLFGTVWKFCLGLQLCCCSGLCSESSLQELCMLAGGELWSFNKKHFFSLHPLTSTSRENYRAPKGAGGNPPRMWLFEFQKELCLSLTNVLTTLYAKYRFFFLLFSQSQVGKTSCCS